MRPRKNQASVGATAMTSTRGPGRRGRLQRHVSHIDEEEEERRRIRRERNKLAAARCRKRRVDQTNVLIEETEDLESKKKSLQEEIQKLNAQVDELSFILESHASQKRIKTEVDQENYNGQSGYACKIASKFEAPDSPKPRLIAVEAPPLESPKDGGSGKKLVRPSTLPIIPTTSTSSGVPKSVKTSTIVKKNSPSATSVIVLNNGLTPTPSQLITPSTGLFDWTNELMMTTNAYGLPGSSSTNTPSTVLNSNSNNASLQTPI